MAHERDEQTLREQIVEICRRCYERGFIQSADGNVSARLGENELLVTPSGVNKGYLKPAHLVRTDLRGRRRQAQGKPTGEIALHVHAYALRPDVRAIVHAHPPHSIALSLAGISLAHCVMPEVVFALRATGIPTAPYATPVTEDLPRAMTEHIRGYHAMILERHGSLTLGGDLEEAYNRLEAMEHSARITAIARSLGATTPLDVVEVDRIIGLAGGVGVERYLDGCDECGGCGRVSTVGGGDGAGRPSEADLARALAEARK